MGRSDSYLGRVCTGGQADVSTNVQRGCRNRRRARGLGRGPTRRLTRDGAIVSDDQTINRFVVTRLIAQALIDSDNSATILETRASYSPQAERRRIDVNTAMERLCCWLGEACISVRGN